MISKAANEYFSENRQTSLFKYINKWDIKSSIARAEALRNSTTNFIIST